VGETARESEVNRDIDRQGDRVSVARHSVKREICSGEISCDRAFGEGEGCKGDLEKLTYIDNVRDRVYRVWIEAQTGRYIVCV
jgi:hypothetical protein